ncbi:MAG: hypothetical protein CEE40_03565 [Chloroflexi bacterium B3_Chlor]|nr:MAG: hypothetical protein CEE40_03565 [Chloroflexi bacterium B3_Chlor]
MASVRRVLLILIGVFLLLFVLFMLLSGFYTDLLWFQSLGLSSVFWTAIKAKVGVFFAFSLIFLAFFTANLFIARRLSGWGGFFLPEQRYYVTSRTLNLVLVVAALVLSVLNGLGAIGQWDTMLRYLNQRSFGVLDPIFSQDVAFYVFTLPVYRFLRGWLTEVLLFTLIATAAVYLVVQLATWRQFKLWLTGRAAFHLAALGALFLLVLAWGYKLSAFELLYSQEGLTFGASYTDVHARLLAYNLSFWTVILCVLLLLGGVAAKRPWILAIGGGLWLVVAVGLGGVYPVLMQQFDVQPNELIKERPYIEYNIDLTRRAYGLDKIQELDFGSVADLTAEALAEAEPTIRNIRLWDYRPLRDTYAQIQEIRLYYEFVDVDVDRYYLDGTYRQVTLSAREMATDQLLSRTWVNEHLQFTHGYGLAMSPVNEVTPEGLPELLVRDLPPSTAPGLEITRPELYYGEKTDGYVFVNSTIEEFDYPSGDQNITTTYQGTGGVLLDSPLKRAAFAYRFGDVSVVLSEYLTPESRVMLYRNIHQRVRQVAPFLLFDADPYLVIVDGRLIWLQDAYTATHTYPYSQPYQDRFNYIRNSVKVAIDAHNGDMIFYVVDDEDPLIQTYAAIFPDLFTPWEEMPDGLRAHVRYPEGLFIIQAQMNNTYHMQDPTVFYNKEDQWAVAHEMYAGSDQMLEPYYVTMKLPGEEEEEFILIQPFTPTNKQNMVGWMAARSDGQHYGKLLLYKFPKQELIYGPLQIEARIDQEPTISGQLSLWHQRGSQVIRGNLLVIPIGNSLLYVEPLYLQAETGRMPELKRVIVASGERVLMADTLEEALAGIGGAPVVTVEEPVGEAAAGVHELALSALEHYGRAQEYLQDGDWAGYGAELEAIRRDLENLIEASR